MKDILKSRKDAGLLLAPVLYEFCCRLWYVAAAFSPESEALLFMARGGLRLQYLFDLFLKVNELEMPVRRFPFWISRFAAVKMTFGENPELAVANLVREFSAGNCREMAAALLPGPLYPNRAELVATLPPELAEAPAGRENFFRIFYGDSPFSEALRTHFREQHDIGRRFIEKQFGSFRTLHLVDTGWYGSTLGSLQAGLPAWHWDGLFFGRWNYRGEVPAYFADIAGLMIDAVGLECREAVDVFLEYHHLIEAVLEPDLPSAEYYLPDGSCNAMLPDWEQRTAGGPADEMWSGVKEYFMQEHSVGLRDCTAATRSVLKRWKHLLRYPAPDEARLLEVPPRSADFGKEQSTAVFALPQEPGLYARWRGIRHSLWPPGCIAVSAKHAVRLQQLFWHLAKKAGRYRGAV